MTIAKPIGNNRHRTFPRGGTVTRLLAASTLVAWVGLSPSPVRAQVQTIVLHHPSPNAVVGGMALIRVDAFDSAALHVTNPVQISFNNTWDIANRITLSSKNTYYGWSGVPQRGVFDLFWDTVNGVLADDGSTLIGVIGANIDTPVTFYVRAYDNISSNTQISRTVDVANSGGLPMGSGALLRREGGGALCRGCHDIKSHSSANHGQTYGTWGADCTDCHTPHSTNNLMVIRESIDTPNSGQRSVLLSDYTGGRVAGGLANLSAPGTGICEVCHTQTQNPNTSPRYRNTGEGPNGHPEGNCLQCHTHDTGFVGKGCDTCHNAPPLTAHVDVGNVHATHDGSGAPPENYGVATTSSTATYYQFGCGKCHPTAEVQHQNSVAAGTLVDPHVVDLAFDATTDPEVSGATYTPGGLDYTEQKTGEEYFKYSAGQCSNVYCHGEFPGGKLDNDPFFDKDTQPCGSCHGADAATPPGGGVHWTHVGSAHGGTSLNLPCRTCHEAVVDGTPTITDKSLHVNGAADWDLDLTVVGAAAAYSGLEASASNPPTGTYGQCTNVYCHSNGNPVDGPSASFDVYRTMSWDGANCEDCHQNIDGPGCEACHGFEASANEVIGVSLARKGSTGHAIHINDYSFMCADCHSVTMLDRSSNRNNLDTGQTTHVDLVKDVDFGTWPVATQASVAYDDVGLTCAVYCHSTGQDPTFPFDFSHTGYDIADWDNLPSTSCTSCHDGAQNGSPTVTGLTGAHQTHTEIGSYTFLCETCHGGTASGSLAIASKALHVNGGVDFQFKSVPNMPVGGGNPGQTCTEFYCHSPGADFSGPPGSTFSESGSPNWTTPINNCWGCHGDLASGGAPSYANGAYVDGSPLAGKANSHSTHSGEQCDDCHNSVVNSDPSLVVSTPGLHVNGSYNLAPDAADSIAFTLPSGVGSPGAPTNCTDISCHGGSGTSATWGSVLKCGNCHEGTGDVNDWDFSNGTQAKIDTTEWTTLGHGTVGVDFAASMNTGAADICLFCHASAVTHQTATNPFRLANENVTGDGWNSVCLVCHKTGETGYDPDDVGADYSTKTASVKVDAYHQGLKHTNGDPDGGSRCWDCHDPHGDGSNIKMIGSDLMQGGSDVYGFTGTRTTTDAVFTANATGSDFAVVDPGPTYDGICNVCHTSTLNYTSTSGDAAHNISSQCTSCHSHNQPPDNAFRGRACDSCHNAPPTTPDVLIGDVHATHGTTLPTTYGDATNNSSGTSYDFGCGKCHTLSSVNHQDSGKLGTIGDPHDVDVVFDSVTDPKVTGTHADGGSPYVEQFGSEPYFTYSDGTCSNVYCHGEFVGGNTANDPVFKTWAISGITGCGSCHGVDATTPPSSGVHWTHVGAAHGGTSLNLSCKVCHEAVVNAATPNPPGILETSLHVNGATDWDLDLNIAGSAATYSGFEANSKNPPSAVYGQCDNIYCHSNGTPVDGPTATFNMYRSMNWSGAVCEDCHLNIDGPGCEACHGFDSISNEVIGVSLARKGSTSHATHINDYNFMCADCHSVTMLDRSSNRNNLDTGQTTHVDRVKDVDFGTWPVATQASVAYDDVGLTCAVYCHSTGQNATFPFDFSHAGYDVADWDSLPSTSCTSCHDGAQNGSPTVTGLTGAHQTHTEIGSYTFLCETCHGGTASGSLAIASKVLHVNGSVDFQFKSVPNMPVGGGNPGQTCTEFYCHSPGADFTGPPGSTFSESGSPNWTTPINNCWGCHGDLASGGAPSYANGAYVDGSPLAGKANSHGVHSGEQCDDCHNNVVNSDPSLVVSTPGLHVNGSYNLAPDAADSIAFTLPSGAGSPGTPTNCTDISCHGGSGTSATWGSVLKCGDCHEGTGDVNDWNFSNGTQAKIDTTEWTTLGHGTVGVDFAASMNTGAADICLFCHASAVTHQTATNPFRLANENVTGDGWNSVCLVCHKTGSTGYDPDDVAADYSTKTASVKVDAYHQGLKHTNGDPDGGSRCWDCHDPHGDGSNIKMIGSDLMQGGSDVYGFTGTRTTTDAVFTANATGSDFAVVDPGPTYDGVCNVCHTSTLNYTSTSGNAAHNIASKCTSCHSHNQPPDNAFRGRACDACHNAPPLTPDVLIGDVHATHGTTLPTTYGDATNNSSGTSYDFGCGKCHTLSSVNHQDSGKLGTIGDPHDVDVVFDSLTDPKVTGTHAVGGSLYVEQFGSEPYFSYSNGTCSNVYCHGEFAGGDPGNDPEFKTWAISGITGCGSCHGVDGTTPPVNGVHWTHVGAAHGGTSLNLSCKVCHEAVVDATSPNPPGILETSLHVNGATDWDLDLNIAGAAAAYSGSEANSKNPPSAVYGQCTNIYCHSNGTPVDGPSASFDVYRTMSWSGAVCEDCHFNIDGPGCEACHGFDSISNEVIGVSLARKGSTSHSPHVNDYNFMCADCHSVTMLDRSSNRNNLDTGQTTHVDRAKDVDFGTWPVATQASVAYDDVGLTCAVYCHSSGQNTTFPFDFSYGAADVADWDNPIGAVCTSCHDGPQNGSPTVTHLSDAHQTHTEIGSYIMPCETCHGTTVTGFTTVDDKSLHVNGVPDLSFKGVPHTPAGLGNPGQTCTEFYCHSPGADFTGPPGSTFSESGSPNWATPINNCWGCHGDLASGGAPSYASGAYVDGSPLAGKANSHSTHSGEQCDDCHNNVVNSDPSLVVSTPGLHANGTYELAPDAADSIAFTLPSGAGSPGSPTNCTDISCHGGAGTTATWGTVLKCGDCHEGTGDVNDWNFSNGTQAKIDTTEWTTLGHGTVGVDFAASMNTGAADICLFCHASAVTHQTATNPFRLANENATGDGWNSVCLVCHKTASPGYDPDGGSADYSSKTASVKVDAYHQGLKHTNGDPDGGSRCWDCHDPHGDASNIKMIGSDLMQGGSDVYGFTGTRTTTDAVFTANATGSDYAVVDPGPTYDGVCNVCHTSTLNYTSTSGDAAHNIGSKCTNCHQHNQVPNNNAFQGRACDSCHNAPPLTPNAAIGDVHGRHTFTVPTTYGDATNSSSGANYDYGCGKCHTVSDVNHQDSGKLGTIGDPHDADVVFDAVDEPKVTGTHAVGGSPYVEQFGSEPYFSYSDGTCSNVYCHGEFAGGNTGNDPQFKTWAISGITGCGSCHGVDATTPPVNGVHWTHVGAAHGGTSLNLSCKTCHEPVVDATTPNPPGILDRAFHVNGSTDWNLDLTRAGALATYSGTAIGVKTPPSTTYGNCLNVYCHSNGTPVDGPGGAPLDIYRTMSWTGGTCEDCHFEIDGPGCEACHGFEAGSNYVIGVGATRKGSVSHATHINLYALMCDDCHATTMVDRSNNRSNLDAGQATHVDGTKDVDFSTWPHDHSAETFTAGTADTCGGVYCHSDGTTYTAPFSGNTVAAWDGSVLVCSDCHGSGANGRPAYSAGVPKANSHQGSHVGFSCDNCHGTVTDATPNIIGYGLHADGVYDVSAGGGSTFNVTTQGSPGTPTGCGTVSCHSSRPDPDTW